MSTQQQASQPDPTMILETANAFQRTFALKAAIELDVFTAVAEGKSTVELLARRCQASERGIRILCDYLTILGFLAKQGHEYSLTPVSATYLDRRSTTYFGTITRFVNSPLILKDFENLASAVRAGGMTLGEDGSFGHDNAQWVEFARSMAPIMALPAELMARLVGASGGARWKVLDIAAGHGLFGIAIAKDNPNAEIVAVDWPHVLEVTRENARKAGVTDRHHTIPGSAFDVDFGAGYDLVLLTNFLHHFDRETTGGLLRKIHAALNTGGRAATLDFVPNEDRVSPPRAAAFNLIMLANTKAGEAYTFAELEAMFRRAGFSRSELHPLPPTPESVVISYK
jgi:2-polyprenyl-3-methyl-5-hydroxy-6-metoxy-1,4-benzoquinol methylase